MNIGVFDSGSGGRFVADKLRRLLPYHSYIVVDDAKNAPYGERSSDDIRNLTQVAIQPLIQSCPLIVIACNTATVSAIDLLRKQYPSTIFVGFEPMIKPAAKTSASGHITLLATRATAYSSRTNQLIKLYARDHIVDIPDTSGWASLIDHGSIDDINLHEVERSVNENNSDVIIIGCTHYIALQPRLEKLGATVLEPTDAIVQRIKKLIKTELQL